MRDLGSSDARQARAWSQGIGGGWRGSSVAAVLERCLAVQAQDLRAGALGIRARGDRLSEADVYLALGSERTVVRGWFMRGTLYVVPTGDAGWLRELLAPQLLRRSERRYRELGLASAELALGERVITEALAAGPLTRDDLAVQMTEAGLEASGQVPFHLIRRSALLGTACFGPIRDDGSATYVLAKDWLPPHAGPFGDEAVQELLGRYLAAHGPASIADFAVWSGLGLLAVRSAWKQLLADGLTEPCRIAGVDGYVLLAGEWDCPRPSGDVRLLPAYDNYLVGFADRRLSVLPEHERAVWPGGGQISPTIVVDGLVRGVWRRDKARGATLEPFDVALGGDTGRDVSNISAGPTGVGFLGAGAIDAEALEAERRDVNRFLVTPTNQTLLRF